MSGAVIASMVGAAPNPAIGTPAALGQNNITITTAGTHTMTITGATVASGDTIWGWCTPGTATFNSITDSASNSYTLLAVGGGVFLFYCVGATALASGTITFSFTYNGNTQAGAFASHVSGVTGFNTAPTVTTGTSASPSISSGALASEPMLIAGFVTYDILSGTFSSESANFTTLHNYTATATHDAYDVVSTTGSVTYAPSLSASIAWIACMATFK